MIQLKDNYATIDKTDEMEKDIEFLKVHTKKLTDWLLKDIQTSIDGLNAQSEFNHGIKEFLDIHQECLERLERDIKSWKLFSFAMTIIALAALVCCIFYQ